MTDGVSEIRRGPGQKKREYDTHGQQVVDDREDSFLARVVARRRGSRLGRKSLGLPVAEVVIFE